MAGLIPMELRALSAADIDAVLRIQMQCYGADFVEPRDVFAHRLQAASHCSWAAVREGEVQAYLAAYWSLPGAITPLHGEFPVYANASVLYLHDMAVSPQLAGQRVAQRMLEAAKAQARARGVQRTALVSVQGSQHYWTRQGYRVEPVKNAAQQQHLASYGEGALYMVGFI